MAACATSADTRRASSEINRANEAGFPTRRGALGTLMLLPALAAPFAESAAPIIDTRSWDAAMSVLVNAEAAYAADCRAFASIEAAYRAACPSEDAVEWDALLEGRAARWPAFNIDAAEAKTKEQIKQGFFQGGRLKDLARRRLAAYDQLRAYQAVKATADRRLGYRLASDRNSALGAAASEAEDALLAMPAPHLSALLWKIERLMFDENGETVSWSFSYIEPMLADARRLLGGAA